MHGTVSRLSVTVALRDGSGFPRATRSLPRSSVLLLLLLAGSPASASADGDLAPAGKVFSDCSGCPEMVVIPPGEFRMGRDDGEPDRYEGPIRRIAFPRAFALGRHEVTTAQYRRFATAVGRQPAPTGCNVFRDGRLQAVPGSSWRDPAYGRPPADDEPVACVTWEDAKAYVAWLAQTTGQPYRLPTEAEWEYAARAGRTGEYAWGNDPSDACREANVFDASGRRARPDLPVPAAECDDGFATIAPVGRLQPNPFGVHDMIGNVWEWVEDCYAMPHPRDAPTDGTAQTTAGCDRRGTRGGSWLSAIGRQRPTFRGRDPVTLTSQIFGFRVARDLPPARESR